MEIDLNMYTQNKVDFHLHSLMCLIGGFLGAYALLNRGGNLGSAQTANLISLVVCLLGANFREFSIRIAGVLLYFLGIQIYVALSHKDNFNLKKYAITIDIIGCIFLSFIPATADPIVGLLPLFFMMSTQWSVFHGTRGYNSSTIFSTNNFRQTALALGEYFYDKDEKHMAKAKFFANSLLWYHLGVAISFISCIYFGTLACLVCLIPSFVCLIIACKEKKANEVTVSIN